MPEEEDFRWSLVNQQLMPASRLPGSSTPLCLTGEDHEQITLAACATPARAAQQWRFEAT
jgi:hypothetical protein